MQTPDDRRGKNNVTDGAETYDKDLFQLLRLAGSKNMKKSLA
jgi:hypothetical protein